MPPTRNGGPLTFNADCRYLAEVAATSRCRSTPATSTGTCCASYHRAGLPGNRVRAAALSGGRLGLHRDSLHLAAGAGKRSTLLMVEATDEFRAPPPGALGGTSRRPVAGHSSRSRPRSTMTRRRVRGRLVHRPIPEGGPTTLYYQHDPIDVEGSRGEQLRVHLQHRRLQRRHLRQRPPAADGASVHGGHRRLRDEFLRKPAESVRAPSATPWYHRDVDYDEIAFFHGGSLYGIPMPPGLSAMRRKGCTTARRRRRGNAGARASSGTFARRLAGHRRRHPTTSDTGRPGARTRPRTALMYASRVREEYDRFPYLVAFQNDLPVSRRLCRGRRDHRAEAIC